MTLIPIQPFTREIMNSAKSTRTRFTIAKKIVVLDRVKDGKVRSKICRNFSLASSTLFQFIKDVKKIRILITVISLVYAYGFLLN